VPDTVNSQAADAVNFNNVKVLGEVPAHSIGLAMQNAVSQQQRVNEIATASFQNALTAANNITQSWIPIQQAMVGRVARHVLDVSAEQAAAFEKQLGAEVSDRLSDIGGALAGVQEFVKTAQTTPPQTGTGGAFGSETGLSQQIALALSNLAAGQAAIVELLRNKA
jgi:hypothetical protein